MLRRSAIVLAAALVAGGCGGTASSAGDFEGEEAEVAQVVEDLEAASKSRDGAEICRDLLAKPLADAVAAGGRSCASEMKKAVEDADAFELDVETVAIRGTTATARVKGRDEDDAGVVRTFEFAQEGGAWRATSFGAED